MRHRLLKTRGILGIKKVPYRPRTLEMSRTRAVMVHVAHSIKYQRLAVEESLLGYRAKHVVTISLRRPLAIVRNSVGS